MKDIIQALIICLLTFWFIWSVLHLRRIVHDECIINHPMEAIGGSADVFDYEMNIKGHRKNDGAECFKRLSATKKEYELWVKDGGD